MTFDPHRLPADDRRVLGLAPSGVRRGLALAGRGPLRLWLLEPGWQGAQHIDLQPASAAGAPRHVVPAGWWQAAEPLGPYAYVGATVGPGFDFADFAFGRDDAALREALARIEPQLQRLLWL